MSGDRKRTQNIDTKDLTKFLTDGIIQGDARQRGMNIKDFSYETFKSYTYKPFIDKMVEKYAVMWLIRCITKYDETYFHKIMNNTYISTVDGRSRHGFDFIRDWRAHHPKMFYFFIKGAKMFVAKQQDIISFDSNAYMMKIQVVVSQLGWTIYPQEAADIRDTIAQIIQLIVS